MKRSGWLATCLFTASFVVPAFAGGGGNCHEKATGAASTNGAGHDGAAAKMTRQELEATLRTRGWAGLEVEEGNGTGKPTVSRVVEGSPAAAGGFRVGDVLVALNGVDLSKGYCAAMKNCEKDLVPGKRVRYKIQRDGSIRHVSLTLARVPERVLARMVDEEVAKQATPSVAEKGEGN